MIGLDAERRERVAVVGILHDADGAAPVQAEAQQRPEGAPQQVGAIGFRR